MQSCYIPWKGYFDMMNSVDEFILYDDRQYTKNDWRNRNRIKTPQGLLWLTIPIARHGIGRRIDEVVTADAAWAAKHWKTLTQFYGRAAHFDAFAGVFEPLYRTDERRLSVLNRSFLTAVCDVLGIRTPLVDSTAYEVDGERTQRLVRLCQAAGANAYLSGPRARAYLDERLFADAGVQLTYMDYEGYPEYPQLFPPFAHEVTILDLIFNVGNAAPRFMKSFD